MLFEENIDWGMKRSKPSGLIVEMPLFNIYFLFRKSTSYATFLSMSSEIIWVRVQINYKYKFIN